MNRNSNTYIILYASIMVIVVAALLSVAAYALKGRQTANVEMEKKAAILGALGWQQQPEDSREKEAYIDEAYAQYVTDSYAVNDRGERISDVNAFDMLNNLKGEFDKPASERTLPVFVGRGADNKTLYVLPVWGAGLWGPIWGYVALEDDWTTIAGVVFDHKSETPGLGAEIATPAFAKQFVGKSIFEGANLTSIAVLKGTNASAGNVHAVDAVSGGTITSRGVEAMLRRCLEDYEPYIRRQREAVQQAPANENSNSHA